MIRQMKYNCHHEPICINATYRYEKLLKTTKPYKP